MTAIALSSELPRAPKHLLGLPRTSQAEAADLSAGLLFDLPLPPALGLHVPGVAGVIRVTTDGESEDGDICFDSDEWRALVLATEADRVWPADFAMFCRRKAADPAWRLAPADALAGGQPDGASRMGLGEVLERLGTRLLTIELA